MVTRTTNTHTENIPYTPYSIHVLTPNSCNFTRVMNQPAQQLEATPTSHQFPQRGNCLGNLVCAHSASPTIPSPAHLRETAPCELEHSYESFIGHPYPTCEVRGLPIQQLPGQMDLATELNNPLGPIPEERVTSIPSTGQQLLAELALEYHGVGNSPHNSEKILSTSPQANTTESREAAAVRYKTPSTPSVFYHAIPQSELLGSDRSMPLQSTPPARQIEEEVHNLSIQGQPIIASTESRSQQGSFHTATARGQTTSIRNLSNIPREPPVIAKTPLSEFRRTYANRYREIMSESPINPQLVRPTHNTSSAIPQSTTHLAENIRPILNNNIQAEMHDVAEQICQVMARLGIHEGRTVVGWLRLLHQIMNDVEGSVTAKVLQRMQEENNLQIL
ncbi:hypothetical protein GYMLUDRAFT_62323 [Collybiopsis luxurians FD-317 M1]|uniref:Uncharacterized protein n=1 Tax=Collybiopsis luxurians FD-317 M1 TaxID=944289 RepID=A0A0D0C0N8_9AGAR|nr:hypothetical protein GYMLUDRAFT_62323 [Collybiopsis luxurians FD-317 M1]